MLENLKKYKIVLASNSPRRRNLLSGLDIDFEVRVISDIDESYPDSIDSMEIPLYIARSKAEAYKPTMADDELLITADTIVWTFDGVMGKPANREEAYAMLHALSDHVHQVITGVCIMTKDKNVGFSVESAVCFAKLGDEEINLKSATKLFSVLLASKRPLITELADKLRLKYPLLPTISPCPTMRLEAIRSIIPISCRRYPKSV
ncbi:Maf family protein [Parabacteroides distasonis]|uniref:Maf family protein n=1 Tax=Parabacteroides distasonis TaxID=823 RepID=UPI0021CAC4BA|nr:Maf family protein [Parabacteroides distasonis]